MSGKKKQRQAAAEQTSAAASQVEQQKAAGLQTELENRRDIVGNGLPQTVQATRIGAEDLRATGGLDETKVAPIRSGYSDLAMTGGFTPVEKESFLRRATAPVSAMYSRMRDTLSRNKTLTGGMGNYDASTRRLTRDAATSGAEASLGANVDLANQIRTGKQAGLAGQTSLLGMEQQGKIQGQDALQKYTQFGAAALSDVDVNELRNRLQVGQMSQADAQLLTTLAAQDKTLFDKIMQGVSVAAGAASGVAGALK